MATQNVLEICTRLPRHLQQGGYRSLQHQEYVKHLSDGEHHVCGIEIRSSTPICPFCRVETARNSNKDNLSFVIDSYHRVSKTPRHLSDHPDEL